MINRFQGEYRFLSNFWPAQVNLDGMDYPTVEHAYQAAKTINLYDRKRIQEAGTPGEAKRIGRSVVLRSGWEFIKVQVMYELIREKFEPLEMRKLLEETGDQMLVEGNDWGDAFWGVAARYTTVAKNRRTVTNHGENWLGRILMNVRKEHQEHLLNAVLDGEGSNGF